MVGYNTLMVFGDQVDETNPLWGNDIIQDGVEKMKIYMECTPGKFTFSLYDHKINNIF